MPALSAFIASAGYAIVQPKRNNIVRAGSLAIITAAIALWNTVYLGRGLDDLRRGEEIIPDPLLAVAHTTRPVAMPMRTCRPTSAAGSSDRVHRQSRGDQHGWRQDRSRP